MARTIFRDANDGLEEEYSILTGLFIEPSEDKAVQSGKDDADINVILRRFNVTGQITVPNMEPFYGDFTDAEDYVSAMDRVLAAQDAFMKLSAETRHKFHNDPAELMEYLHSEFDDKKLAEAREMGLIDPQAPPPAPMRVVVDNFPAPPGEGV